MEYVNLNRTDLDTLIETSQAIIDFKFRALSRTNWQIFERDYLPPLVKYFSENKFKVVTASDNIFVWFIDQIVHSRDLVPGVKPKDCVPLCDTELGIRALEICRAARYGQDSYNRRTDTTTFNSLFNQ
jgi:hypothetical protein